MRASSWSSWASGRLTLSGVGSAYGTLTVARGPLTLTGATATTALTGGMYVGFIANSVPGSGDGTIDIADGQISAGWIQVGDALSGAVTGTINQTGGAVQTTGNGGGEGTGVRLGHYPSGTASYNLSGGSLTVGGGYALACAIDGTGTFYQTGGTASADKVVVNLRGDAAGSGTFTLDGGTFTVGAGGLVNEGSGTATVNLGGGTLKASAGFSSSLPMNLTNATGPALVDTNGYSVGLSVRSAVPAA